jgi:hypothetical protein
LVKGTFRFGFAAVVGKPNVGKSSLVNRLTGVKVSITSRRPQTTRNRILGIVNGANFQLALVDTPGIHRPRGPPSQSIDRAARNSIGSADITVMVIDGLPHPFVFLPPTTGVNDHHRDICTTDTVTRCPVDRLTRRSPRTMNARSIHQCQLEICPVYNPKNAVSGRLWTT